MIYCYDVKNAYKLVKKFIFAHIRIPSSEIILGNGIDYSNGKMTKKIVSSYENANQSDYL
jgi:hypothetical protein